MEDMNNSMKKKAYSAHFHWENQWLFGKRKYEVKGKDRKG